MTIWDHALVQDANDQNAVRIANVKDNVFSKLETTQTWLESVAGSPDRRVRRQEIKTPFQLGEIFVSLVRSQVLIV
jgi:hypothetical protein